MSQEESGRPKRKVKRLPTKKPAASHYVGYVDDEETPEMIMKKFEMLDKILEASQKGLFKEPPASKPKKGRPKRDKDDYAYEKPTPPPPRPPEEPLGPDQLLTEHQLSLLFKMTSSFNVPADGILDYAYDGFYEPDQFDYSDEENYFMGEDEFFSNDGDKKSKKRKREGTGRIPKERNLKGVGTYKPKLKLLSMELMGDDGLYYTIKKKVKMVDPLQPTYVRIPSQVPLPRSWARTIAPYSGLNLNPMPEGYSYLETDIIGFDLKTLNRKFQGILIDPPWHISDSDATHPHYITPLQLAQLKVDEIIDNGLLLCWAEKHHIASCIQVASKWGFTYVENLIWVKQNVDHTVSDQQHAFFAKSKTTLLIFKKGNGFTLKHQRNPDVIFDFVRHNKYLTTDKPKYAYTIAETLLPDACFSEDTKQGQFLEIWARRGSHRKGWTSLVQTVPPEPLFLPSGPDSIPLVID